MSTCNVWHTGLVTECVIRLIALAHNSQIQADRGHCLGSGLAQLVREQGLALLIKYVYFFLIV